MPYKKDEQEWEVNSSILDQEQEIDTNLWTVPYGNLMTILMIFFMSLYSFAYMGNQSTKYEKTMANLQSEMGNTDARKRSNEINMAEKLDDYIEKSDMKKFVSVAVTAQNIKITLSNPVLFDSGSSDIKTSAHATLDEIGLFLEQIPNPVAIEGHTDNIPIATDKFRSNFELSGARAFSVIDYFINIRKIKSTRFSCLGYGEFSPVASNDSEDGRGKNRRIEINIVREE